MKKLAGKFALALVAAALLAWAFRPVPVEVETAVASEQAMSVYVRDEGRWEVLDLYRIAAPVPGLLLRVDVEVGDAVAAGDAVAWMAPAGPAALDARSRAQAEAALRSAEAAVALARAEHTQTVAQYDHALAQLRRARDTARKGSLSAAELENAEFAERTARAVMATASAAVTMREAERDNAQAVLAPITGSAEARQEPAAEIPLPAPIDGQVFRILTESEQTIAAGTPVLEFGNPAQMEVVADILSRDAHRVNAGAAVILDESDHAIPGTVRRVEPYGYTKVSALGIDEQRVRVHITAEALPDGIGHGYRTDVAIRIWSREKTLQIPLGSLFRNGERWAVYVLNLGRAQLRNINIGQRNRTMAEVTNGLKAGEQVILYPGERVTDGTRISAAIPPAL